MMDIDLPPLWTILLIAGVIMYPVLRVLEWLITNITISWG